MSHFGIISPPTSGYLNPFGALGRELQDRGHTVTCFQTLDMKSKVEAEGIGYYPIGQTDFPIGSIPKLMASIGAKKGITAVKQSFQAIKEMAEMVCRDGPEAIRRAGVDTLLVSQPSPEGACLADHLGLPYISLSMALPYDQDISVPPPFTSWAYSNSALGRMRNKLGYLALEWLTRSIQASLTRIRRAWGLVPYRKAEDSFSKLLQIGQLVGEMDFPRKHLPASFQYCGPLRRPHGEPPAFPWEKLDGRPAVFGSLGTQQGSKLAIFQCFAEACAELKLQLVIAHGGNLNAEGVSQLSTQALVVNYAPQLELIPKTVLTLTHAGLNTVLDSLTYAVPLVAVPITYEQPAVARRIEWSGTGRMVRMKTLTTRRLRAAMEEVLTSDSYKANVLKVQASIQRAGGVVRAASLIEAAVSTT